MIDRVVGFPFHRGILACGRRRPWPSLRRSFRTTRSPSSWSSARRSATPENLRRDRANRRCFRDRRDPRRPGMPRPALTPGAPRLDGRRTAAAGDRLAASIETGRPTGPGIRFRADRRRRRHRRRALRRRPQAPTARAGARRRARRHRPRVAGVLPDGHDPDASGRELAERRRGGRNTWCITFGRPPRNRTDGNPRSRNLASGQPPERRIRRRISIGCMQTWLPNPQIPAFPAHFLYLQDASTLQFLECTYPSLAAISRRKSLIPFEIGLSCFSRNTTAQAGPQGCAEDGSRRPHPVSRRPLDRLAQPLPGGFHDRLGVGRVRVHGVEDLFLGGLELLGHHQLGDQLGGLRADQVGAQELAVLGVEDELDEALGLVRRPGPGR